MRTVRRIGFAFACLIAGAASVANAQGSLSLLGFGYPAGGASTRALGAGASLAGLDPQSPVNPASIVLGTRLQAYLQFEPEYRSVSAGGPTVRTTTSRFPLFVVSARQTRATFALSFSSFMDRTWSTSYADTQVVASERIASTVFTSSVGGIADVRGAVAWTLNPRVHFGVAAHVYPGDNRVTFGRAFSDSSKAGGFQLEQSYNFSGTAMSFGAVWMPVDQLVLGGDLRAGGPMRMRLGDSTVVGTARIPLRAGVTASYSGIPGAVFTVRMARDSWTDLAGLGSASLGVQDATDISAGTEILGPRLGESQFVVRAGYRQRGLPFTYGTTVVKERSITGGLGLPVAGSRAMIDLGISRASRTASTVSEKAWLVSLGVGIRP